MGTNYDFLKSKYSAQNYLGVGINSGNWITNIHEVWKTIRIN